MHGTEGCNGDVTVTSVFCVYARGARHRFGVSDVRVTSASMLRSHVIIMYVFIDLSVIQATFTR